MEKLKDFLHRKDIEISVKRYGIDALGAMAQGLFCSLLIGTIINTLGSQLHIPFLIWMSDSYREAYPEHWEAVTANKEKNISSSSSFFPTMLDLGGIKTPYRDDSQSVATPLYKMRPRVYLNDHNEPRPLDDLGMKKQDFHMLEKQEINT